MWSDKLLYFFPLLFFMSKNCAGFVAGPYSNRLFHRNAGNPSITSELLQIPYRVSHRGFNVNVQREHQDNAPAPSRRKIGDFYPAPAVVGGLKATHEDSQYQASIRYVKGDVPFGKGHTCSGCLINRQNVITAAHCFFVMDEEVGNAVTLDPINFKVVLGTLNRFKKTNDTLMLNIRGYIFHENFNYASDTNDIGIVELSAEIPENHPAIAPISIANERYDAGTKCQVSGFGANLFQGKQDEDLLITTVTLYSNDNCKQVYGSKLFDGMVCAGDWYGKFATCEGDSGGPLVCNGVLYGLISWGHNCGKSMLPGIYTELYYYQDWIENNILRDTKQRGQDNSLAFRGIKLSGAKPQTISNCVAVVFITTLCKFFF